LYAIEGNFTAGKLPGQMSSRTNTTTFRRAMAIRAGPGGGEQWEFVDDRDQQAAVDDGDGTASVKLPRKDQ